jgi:ApaG protein
MYSEITDSIKISVNPVFLEEQSDPDDFHYVWAYHVCIENQRTDTVQLMTRRWHITDSQGRINEVRGEGVVGEKPILKPGETYEYTSGAPLSTPSGFMVGSYQMIDNDGVSFDVSVPAFSLDSPHDVTLVS